MQKGTKANPNEPKPSKWSFRPMAYIGAFFNPLPKEELRATLDKSQEIMDKADKTNREHDELHKQIEADLSNTKMEF